MLFCLRQQISTISEARRGRHLHGTASETPSILPGHIEARFCTFRFPVPDMMRFVCEYEVHHFVRSL